MLSRSQHLVAGWGIFLPLGWGPDPAGAQPDSSRADLEAKTVEVSAEVYAGNKTPEEARRQAIDRAQAEAVRRVIGTQVQAQRQRSQIETGDEVVSRFSQVVRTGASGRVVDIEVLTEDRPRRDGEFFHRVRIRATVEPATGHRPPGSGIQCGPAPERRGTGLCGPRLEDGQRRNYR
ncbi:MAG: hypothetical protein ABEK75_12405 [Salinibacter sp.]